MVRRLFNPVFTDYKMSIALLLIRVVVGVLMLSHGMGKFTNLFSGEVIQFSDPLGIGATASLALAVFSEVLCSILIIFGFATRLAAVPLLITMLVAAFVVHINDGIAKQELSLLYGIIYVVIAIAGAGKYSIDHYLYKKN